jgi:hypothetical protein
MPMQQQSTVPRCLIIKNSCIQRVAQHNESAVASTPDSWQHCCRFYACGISQPTVPSCTLPTHVIACCAATSAASQSAAACPLPCLASLPGPLLATAHPPALLSTRATSRALSPCCAVPRTAGCSPSSPASCSSQVGVVCGLAAASRHATDLFQGTLWLCQATTAKH